MFVDARRGRALAFEMRSFQHVPGPCLGSRRKRGDTRVCVTVYSIGSVPSGFPVRAGPHRRGVAATITGGVGRSLLGADRLSFCLLGQKVLLSTGRISCDGCSGRLAVDFRSDRIRNSISNNRACGAVLGCQSRLSPKRRCMGLRVLANIRKVFRDLTTTHGASIRMRSGSVTRLRSQFRVVGGTLGGRGCLGHIFFGRGSGNSVSITSVLTLLGVFGVSQCSRVGSFPVGSCDTGGHYVSLCVRSRGGCRSASRGPCIGVTNVVPSVFQLCSTVRMGVGQFCQLGGPGNQCKTAGKIRAPGTGRGFGSGFLRGRLRITSPGNFVCPVLKTFHTSLRRGSKGCY